MGYQRLLLVEGRNDQYVLRGLLRKHHISCFIPDRDPPNANAIAIDQADGIKRLLERLEVILDDGNLTHLGIVVDADEDVAARWDALRGIFSRFGGGDLPKSPASTGTLITLQQPYRLLQVGVWIMPDNQVPGILENFVSFLIPHEKRPLWEKAQACVNTIPPEHRLFPEVKVPKAQIHTWLAWQKEPGQPLGNAITARYLDVDAPHAVMLIDWVKRVFTLP